MESSRKKLIVAAAVLVFIVLLVISLKPRITGFATYNVGSGQQYGSLAECLLNTSGMQDRCVVVQANYSEIINGTYIFYNNSIGVSASNITINCNNSFWYGDGTLHWYYTDVGFNNITFSNCRQQGYDVGYVLRGDTFTLNNIKINSSISQGVSANLVNSLAINNSVLKGKILLNDVTGARILNTTINYQAGQAPSIDANSGASGINIVNIIIENNPEGHGIGMQDPGTDLLVENSTINDTINAGKISIFNSTIQSADDNLVNYMAAPSDIFIRNSLLDCQNSSFMGITFTNLNNLTIEGNIIGNCSYGVYSDNSYDQPANVYIKNNILDNNNGSIYFNNAFYDAYFFEIINNTLKNLKPQTLAYDHYTTNSPRRYNSQDYDYNSGTHYFWFPAGNYQEVTADDTALNSVFDGTENLSICMNHLTSPVNAYLTSFGRMSEFNSATNYSDWCSGIGYTCSCDYFRVDFILANGNESNYTIQTDTNLTTVSSYTSPHTITYSALPNFYNLIINANSTIQNNTFFSNISIPFDVYIKNSNFTINNLLSNGIKSISGNNFCINNEGNFYKEGLAVPSGDCGQANVTYPVSANYSNSTINITWKKQSSPSEVSYDIFRQKLSDSSKVFIGNITGLFYLWDITSVVKDNYRILLIPWINGSRYNATNVYSENFTIANHAPNQTSLMYPQHQSAITDRTPNFNWTASADADNDNITYNLLADNDSNFNSPEINVTQAATNYTPLSDMSFADYYWKVLASDGNATNASETKNFTLLISISCSLPVNSIDFGDLLPRTSENTTSNSPPPLIIQNNGNVRLNITTNSTDLWESASNPSEYYQLKIGENETGSYTSGQTSWTNFTKEIPLLSIVELKYPDANDDARIDVLVRSPPDEGAGNKSSTVQVWCESAE